MPDAPGTTLTPPDKRKTGNASRILDRITSKNPKLREMIAEQRLNVRIAEMIYAAREASVQVTCKHHQRKPFNSG